MGNTYIKAFTDLEMDEFAHMWKKYGRLLNRLSDAIIYKATVDLVESKREKEVVEQVAVMQNDMLQGFYDQRVAKTKKLDSQEEL